MSSSSASNEYLLLSRGQWDPEKSQDEIQSAIDSFYAWYRFLHSTAVAKKRIKAREQARRTDKQPLPEADI